MNNTWHPDEFTSALATRLAALFSEGVDAAALARGVTACAEAAEALCQGRPMACSAGCPHCCVLNAAALLPEAMIIAQWLRERLSPPELGEMRKALAAHRSGARWMEDEERIARQMACPLLDSGGSCLVHPVRPLVCRAAASLDSESCREAFSPMITDEVRAVPADLLRQAAYDAAFATLGQTLRLYGVDHRSIELGTGVLAFLEHPEFRDLIVCGGKLPGVLWLA